MILVPLFILIAMIGVKMQKGIFMSFLVLVATKSIMDAFWEIKLGPLSILAVQGILIPVLYSEIFFKRKIIPKRWLDSAKIYVLALSLGLIWAIAVKPMATVETVILNVNIYLGFILIPIFITDQKRLKQLLIAVMICGIFPILVSVYQLNTGVVFQERQTVGLTRYVGFYHDAFPVRFFGLMTLISILIYQSVFNIKGFLFKAFILLLAGGAFVSIYAVFSKAGVGIIGLWIVLLLLFSKSKVKQSFSVLIGLLVIFLVFGDAVSSNIEQLFSKEVGYQTGEVTDARYTLAGRGYIWQEYWNFWTLEQSAFFQWFGDGINRPVHNEFFRVLMVNGIFGVLILLVFILRKIKNIFKIHKNVRVFGMMLLGMYTIDCIGLVPGEYYYYNILVWGIFGTLLMKPQLFIKQK
ncbi:O-antigen ligase family protein [Winogradskyella sp. Asnod2-B02-A]|uniref:O-antigen ligase family protein n=1 Tax=Winogradskyella sp. Asnod2-B02-A TaxID=3160583 RepID=UPI00386B1FBF